MSDMSEMQVNEMHTLNDKHHKVSSFPKKSIKHTMKNMKITL